MKQYYLPAGALLLLAALAGVAYALPGNPEGRSDKVYAALEDEGAIAVLDVETNRVIQKIDLTDERTGMGYSPHNVQTAPDGSYVWVTANAAMKKHARFELIPRARADEGHADNAMADQIIAINPQTDEIVQRIPVGSDQHLSHIVQKPGGEVFAAAQETDLIYVLNPATMTIVRTIALPPGSGPHGIRLSPDGATLYAALMEGRGLGIVDTNTGAVETIGLDGIAVQVGTTPDGATIAASLYDARAVALVDTKSKAVTRVQLPQGSQGPVQLYPTEDSRFFYVADQGVLEGRPANTKVYKIDIDARTVVETLEAGAAPHGIVIAGSLAYVTNLSGNSISVLDLADGKEIAEVPVGQKPNGITVWKRTSASTAAAALQGARITVYKSPTCGCCGGYIAELRRQGAEVLVEEVSDAVLIEKKKEFGVPAEYYSCHTSRMDGYTLEGHIPMSALVQLRTERPQIAGIALPGMPAGSPGMGGVQTAPFEVMTLEGDTFGMF